MKHTQGPLAFQADGRAYTCNVEPLRGPRPEPWWWFGVVGDANRYACFRAEADDSPETVQERIIAYYEARLARRALPWTDRGPRPTAGAPGVAAAPPAS